MYICALKSIFMILVVPMQNVVFGGAFEAGFESLFLKTMELVCYKLGLISFPNSPRSISPLDRVIFILMSL